jgi:hypothetical protein
MPESVCRGNAPKLAGGSEAQSSYVLIKGGTGRAQSCQNDFVNSAYINGGLIAGSQEAFQCFCSHVLKARAKQQIKGVARIKVKVFYTLLAMSIIQVLENR